MDDKKENKIYSFYGPVVENFGLRVISGYENND